MAKHLAAVGEEEAVKRILGILRAHWECPTLGPGDDASCAGPGWDRLVVKIDGYRVSSSMLPWNSLRDVGWKAVTATASDLAAKAARPLVFLASTGLSPERGLEELVELVEGLQGSAIAHGAWLGGGDTNAARSRGCEWIDVAGLGFAARKPLPITCSSGNRLLVYTTRGRIGLTGIAYHIAFHGDPEEINEWPRVLAETSRPIARTRFPLLVERLPEHCVRCASDVSDGLAYTLYRLAEESSMRITVEELPVEREAEEYAGTRRVSLESLVFYAGEEYEVVFAVEPSCRGLVEGEAARIGLPIGFLGVAEKNGDPLVVYRGSRVEKKRWDQFRGWA